MEVIQQLWSALWHYDAAVLTQPNLVYTLYGILFSVILLENGFLPTAFLPGDSLLVLVGVLAAKGGLSLFIALLVLIAAASTGSWLGYIQGRWLSNRKFINNWLNHIPQHYHSRAHDLFHKHGLAALFIGRFLAFVRTLLPMLAGISGLGSRRFFFFNCLSSTLWVTILVSIGYLFGSTPLFNTYQEELMKFLLLIPISLLVISLIGTVILVVRKKSKK